MPTYETNKSTELTKRSGMIQFLHDKRGNIMPMAAIGMIAMAGMVGGGVDISRGYMVQNRLQNACDSGVLAGRRAVAENGYNTAAQSQAENYFYTNFDQGIEGSTSTTFVTTATENDNRIDGLATTKLDTAVMSLFGFDEIDISVDCTASMSVGNSDVVMILDVTGSMSSNLGGQTRLRALQDAMKGFYDTVQSASAGSNARIRYGFVPYSSAVNVGGLIVAQDPNYIADSVDVHTRVAQTRDVEVQEFAGWGDPTVTTDVSVGTITRGPWSNVSGPYRRWRECNSAKPSNTGWSTTGTNTAPPTDEEEDGDGNQVTTTTTTEDQSQTQYRCRRVSGKWYVQSRERERERITDVVSTSEPIYTTVTTQEFSHYRYQQETMPTTTFKTFASTTTTTGTDGADETSTWDGCIQERKTVTNSTFSWDSITGVNPSGALDLDIDTAPNPSDADTQWKPMWHQITYNRTNSYGNWSSSNTSDYGAKTYYACPRAAQLLAPMTEGDFDLYADSLVARGNTYHDLGMIWGARIASPDGIFQDNVTENPANGGSVARHVIFMTDGAMVPYNRMLTTYGIETYDKRVTGNGYSSHADRHRSRFLAVCAATKAKGIRVWVIAFASSLTANLEECSSDGSSFLAANSSQLNAAFQEIAKDVGELRVVQ